MGARAWTWETLGAETLRRQFPRVRGRGEAAVVETVRRIGAIQAQSARAPFLGVAARLPGASYDTVTAAHESLGLVRSTSLRGTVHTSTRAEHAVLSPVAARALAPLWRRTLLLDDTELADFRAELEEQTAAGWATHDALETHMRGWLGARGKRDSATATGQQIGRYAFRGHPAMLRRPRSGGWASQAEVVYRAARFELGEEAMDAQQALVALVRSHLGSAGPLTRQDLAWWSGAGLRQVDAAVEALGEEVVVRPGPDGHSFLDLADPPRAGFADLGVRLLPEFDALVLGYAPAGRYRFAEPELLGLSWSKANGVHSPTVLLDGRLRGTWRLTRSGGGDGTIDVRLFPGEALLDPADLTEPAAAVGAVLALSVTDVTIAPWPS